MMISVDYTYNIPNQWLVDHSFTEGKTRETTYDGPDKIYLIIDNETGQEFMGPITEREKNDGRPLPLNCRYVEVDCIEYPLIAQLRAPVIDEAEDNQDTVDDWILHPLCVPVDGYPSFKVLPWLIPSDIYDKHSITVDENDIPSAKVKTPLECAFGGKFTEYPDWELVKRERGYRLQHSDSQLALDMPEALATEWKIFRQRLRDLPTALAENPAWIALQMFPESPDDLVAPRNN